MKRTQSQKFLSAIMALIMIITCLVPAAGAVHSEQKPVLNEDGEIITTRAAQNTSEAVTIMVELSGETAYVQTGDLQVAAASTDAQLSALAQAESRIEATLSQSLEVENRYSLLFNGFSFTGESWMIDAINEMDSVRAFEAPMFELVTPTDETEMDLTPSMGKSTNLTGAVQTWDLGYSGEGMAIAIIDTGIRQTHEAFSVAPQNPKADLAYLLDVYNEYGEYLHCGTVKELNDIYYSEKLPFNWDYFDGDAIPNHTSSDHGSHVAGIAAGNNGANFKGVAPEAQIFTMQVFNKSGGASFATVLAALEDCVYLGVDSINMSLGVAASWTNYTSVGLDMEPVYTALENAGISVIAAAGNEYTAYRSDSTVGTLYWRAENPDNGMIGAPAVFEGSLAVASITNADKSAGYHMTAYGEAYAPVASTNKKTPAFSTLGYEEFDLIYVGTASAAALEGLDVTGKIALAARDSSTTYQTKVNNAKAAGAIGILVYNNVAGSVKTSASSTIPVATLTQAEGERLVRAMTGGEGKIRIVSGTPYAALVMASSSSWGTTTNLDIKPEITAPGGTVNSVNGNGGDTAYKNNSGTSMASPHVAGGVVLVKQRLREVYPEATATELNNLAYSYLMSTAHPINDFVRRQGAGVMDVEAAVSTPAYLSVPGQSRPKLELQDSADGTFTLTFVINNEGDTQKTYSISPVAMTEGALNYTYSGKQVKRLNGSAKDVTAQVNFSGAKTVSVAANSTTEVTMTISLTEELAAYYAENFTSGMYLEGFIKLLDQDENGVDLSIPYLGFVGDWDYPSMIDDGFYWQTAYGEYNPAQSKITAGTYIGSGIREQNLGLNPYADMVGETYLADRNAISPNADGYLDSVDYAEFSLLRNPKTVKLYLQDAEGNVLATYLDKNYSYRKEYSVPGMNGGLGFSSIAFNCDGAELEENETAYLVLEAWLDREGFDIAENKNGRLVFPVTKDLTAPAVTAVEGGVEILDANYTAYYAVYADVERTEQVFETGVFAMERGQKETYTTDLTTYFVAVADYARNEAFYMVENGVVTKLEADGFGHNTRTVIGRTYYNYGTGEEEYAFVEYNPETHLYLNPVTEVSSEKTAYNNGSGQDYRTAAIDKDGTVYLTSKDHLLKLDPETYEVTEVAKYWVDKECVFNAQCLTVDPETYEFYLYSYTNALGGWNYVVCKLDVETGEVTPLWKVPSKLGTVSTSGNVLGMTFVDTGVLAFSLVTGYICLADAETGASIENLDLRNYYSKVPNRVGQQGSGGSLLFDKDSNTLYVYSEWQWFRYNHYDYPGVIVVDMTNKTAQLHTIGLGDGIFMHGLYFKEDVKPADFYYAMQLIDAIGEVDETSGEAVEAAREAYNAVREDRKVRVENYETLIEAELAYYGLMAEQCAADARQAAAEARDAMAAAEASAKEAMNTTATDTTAAKKAQAAAEEAKVAAEEAAEAAEEAAAQISLINEALKTAAEAADLAIVEAELKTAAETLPAALTAATEARTAADTAIQAQAKAEHQAQAQVAQNANEGAEDYAAEAKNRAEEIYALATEALNTTAQDKSAAYEALNLAEEVLSAAEVAQTAAGDAAKAAMEAAEAADNLDTATLEEAVKTAQHGEEVAEIYRDIVEILAQQVLDLIDAQKEQEDEEAAALAAARVEAMEQIAELVDETEGYSKHQIADWEAALETALEAVEAAETIGEIEAIMEELEATLETIAASCPATGFTDVTENAWYHEAVDYVILNGMMNGKGNGLFAPEADLTRAELVTVLYRMEGEPSVVGMANPFADVAAGIWYTDAIIWAYHAEVVKGISDTAFAPGANITREQIATILYRYAEAEAVEDDALAGYADAAKVSAWAVDAMNWAVDLGLINGMDEVTLAPRGNATRTQIATILMRYCEN